MGYDFHITRKDHWADDEGPSISLDEWTEYARGDTDINPDPDNPGPENWIVTGRGGAWPLWWNDTGEIVTKNPEPPMIEKMITIANALGARVLGDDDEVYGETSTSG
jgi:hypothetical protein